MKLIAKLKLVLLALVLAHRFISTYIDSIKQEGENNEER